MLTWLVGCLGTATGPPPSTPPSTSITDPFCDDPLADGLPDDDCDGTRADVVPIADAARLTLIGSPRSALGASVACTSLPFGELETAIAAGAPYDEWAGVNERISPAGGAAWVVDGGRTGTLREGDVDLVARAEPSDQLGADVAFAGDVDGDGADELVATAAAARLPETYSGGAYLVGGEVLGEVDLTSSALILPGVDRFSRLARVTPAGDLDGDGRADLALVHASDLGPRIVLHTGLPAPLGGEVVLPDAGLAYSADGPGILLDVSFADLDDDGLVDLVPIGLDLAPVPGPLAGGPLVAGAYGGLQPLAVGDLTGDGLADLVVREAPSPDPADRRGGLQVFAGPVDLAALPAPITTLRGETSRAAFGAAVLIADHDGDGVPDLVVTAPLDYRADAGLVYVFGGPLPAGEVDVGATAAVVYRGDDGDWSFGRALAGCDLDHDGDDELLFGSEDWSEPDSPLSPGRVQVVDGGR